MERLLRPHAVASESILTFGLTLRQAFDSPQHVLKGSTMDNKLYVGNLPYSMRDDDLQQQFAQFGSVNSAKVMVDRDTGRSKGFGFVEMGSRDEAQAAIRGLNGQSFENRALVVNEARPREERPAGGFGGGRGGFGGGRRNY